VTSLSTTVDAVTTSSSFTYDASGNRVSQATGADTVSYDWNAEGKLSGVHGAESNESTNTYDASGNRLVRTDASGTTVYLPGGQEILINGSKVSATRYYSFAGRTVAVRSGTGMAGVSSLVCDPHGSVVASVPNTLWTATSVTRVFSDPFGAVRGGSDAGVPGDHRFLGSVRDTSSGLTLLGARFYDESVGRFISVDPLLDSGEPAQFNAYVYSGNNPVTWSDPTGMSWDSFWGDVAKNGQKFLAAAGKWVDNHKPQIRSLVHFVATNPVMMAITNEKNPIVRTISHYFAGMDKHSDGTITSAAQAPQLLGGYNDVYDKVFDATCHTAPPEKFDFTYGDKNYVVWAWKGDYLNLGAGAEIGFYSQDKDDTDEHWGADQDGYIPKMTMSLRGAGAGGAEIVGFAPDKAQNWVAGWKPSMQKTYPKDLAATMTVDFSNNKGMLKAFEEKWGGDKGPWTIKNGVATLNFRRRKVRIR
jgi:RHS repeat-associated protein